LEHWTSWMQNSCQLLTWNGQLFSCHSFILRAPEYTCPLAMENLTEALCIWSILPDFKSENVVKWLILEPCL
jgi:hypothetical protein